MRRFAHRSWVILLLLAALAGCAENALVLKGQTEKLRQEQLALARQKDELQNRASALDRDNQEQAALLAQVRQQNKLLEEQVSVLRDQLSSTTAQLTRLRDEKRATEQKIQAMTASLQRQGGIPITPNNSLLQTLPAINLPDVYVRRDGDVVRVELPSHRMFEPGTARLLPGAPQLVATAVAEVMRLYPQQILGIEGHTDSDPVSNAQYRNNHQLSVARALQVYDMLVTHARVPQNQLFVVGHGGNHPVFSNATPAGKQRNNRIELVVYPETVSR
jgi:chemotaxis protein MotB